MDQINLLNKGYVKLISEGISPDEISTIAGLSHGDGKPSVKNLIQWGHESPLEFSFYIFKIKAPIFVFRQLFRHRTGKFLETSLRYCEADPEYYMPASLSGDAFYLYYQSCEKAFYNYEQLINLNVPKEQARAILPTATYSTAYVGFDMRNLRHFLSLRLDEHAQEEIRQYAQAMMYFIPSEFKEDLDVTEPREYREVDLG